MGRSGYGAVALAWLGAGGCWKTELAQLPSSAVAFAPADIAVPAGWVVEPFESALTCPDGERSRYYVVYPEGATTPLPAAVIYHSGAFDYVFAPDPAAPLDGAHYADPPRLSRDWAARQVFVTLGMVPADTEEEVQTGALPAALANAGVAMILPGNCWGDWWHNLQGAAENQFVDPNGDFFFRNGRASAEWGYRFLIDPGFAAGQQVTVPFPVDAARVYAIGLGSGGRAVGELLNVDGPDEDLAPDLAPAAVLVDSHTEDISRWYADPAKHAGIVAGLDRIFPGGVDTVDAGSLYAAPTLPERTLYAFDPADPRIPAGAHARIMERLDAEGGYVWPVEATMRPVTNGADPAIAQAAVDYLLNGTTPPVSFIGTLDTAVP